jgi:hypothetical protein
VSTVQRLAIASELRRCRWRGETMSSRLALLALFEAIVSGYWQSAAQSDHHSERRRAILCLRGSLARAPCGGHWRNATCLN